MASVVVTWANTPAVQLNPRPVWSCLWKEGLNCHVVGTVLQYSLCPNWLNCLKYMMLVQFSNCDSGMLSKWSSKNGIFCSSLLLRSPWFKNDWEWYTLVYVFVHVDMEETIVLLDFFGSRQHVFKTAKTQTFDSFVQLGSPADWCKSSERSLP